MNSDSGIEITPPANIGNGQEWISCSDRLPEQQDAMECGCVWWFAKRFGIVSDFWNIPNDATHWMSSCQFEKPNAPTQIDQPAMDAEPPRQQTKGE